MAYFSHPGPEKVSALHLDGHHYLQTTSPLAESLQHAVLARVHLAQKIFRVDKYYRGPVFLFRDQDLDGQDLKWRQTTSPLQHLCGLLFWQETIWHEVLSEKILNLVE